MTFIRMPIAEEQLEKLSENRLVQFIKEDGKAVREKLKAHYPSLREDQIWDIFQDVCIALVEKARDDSFRLTCSLFHFVYTCCWNRAEHESRSSNKMWRLPTDDILKDTDGDNWEAQTIQETKVDQLLCTFFKEQDEREQLLDKVCEVVKDLPEPCEKILYGMYGTPKKKQEVLAKECGYNNASVVKVIASRCKSKFVAKFKAIYNAYRRGL